MLKSELMVIVGPLRRTVDFFRLRVWPRRPSDERRLRSDCLCAKVLERLSVALKDAETSADGGSPKMKNLMKAARIKTTESCPTTRPCVKESLDRVSAPELRSIREKLPLT